MEKIAQWFLDLLTFEGMDLSSSLLLLAKAAAIFLICFFLRHTVAKAISAIAIRLARKKNREYDEEIIRSQMIPLEWLIVAVGFYFAYNILPLTGKGDAFITVFLRCAIIVILLKAILNLLTAYEKYCLGKGQFLRIKAERALIPIFIKISKIIASILAVIMIAGECNYSISSMVAGLGLGGLAIALAAQDLLEGIISGFALMTDKNFSLGDWVICDGVEGIIEGINYRNTMIRTFDQQLVTVPNTKLANSPLINWSRAGKRRVLCCLGLTYDTTREQMLQVLADLRQMLKDSPKVDQEKIYVNFDNYGDNALEIQLYYYAATGIYGEYLQIKEDINLQIMEILEKNGVSIAFPSTSVYLENNLDAERPDIK